MSIDHVNALVDAASPCQAVGRSAVATSKAPSRSLSDTISDCGVAAAWSSSELVTLSGMSQPKFVAVQGGLDADTLVALGLITPAEESGLQFCSTEVSDSSATSSSVTVTASEESANVTTPDGSVSLTEDTLHVHVTAEQQTSCVCEAHVLTADGHPIDVLYKEEVGPNGQETCMICPENLNPAGVVRGYLQAIDQSRLSGNDIVNSCKQAYNQVLFLFQEAAPTYDTVSQEDIDIQAATSSTGNVGSADSSVQQATTLFSVIHSN